MMTVSITAPAWAIIGLMALIAADLLASIVLTVQRHRALKRLEGNR